MKRFINNSHHILCEYSTGGAIPKDGWQWFDKLASMEIPDDLPDSLRMASAETQDALLKLSDDLLQNKDIYFVDGYTVTREGRKRIRQTCDKIYLILKKLL